MKLYRVTLGTKVRFASSNDGAYKAKQELQVEAGMSALARKAVVTSDEVPTNKAGLIQFLNDLMNTDKIVTVHIGENYGS